MHRLLSARAGVTRVNPLWRQRLFYLGFPRLQVGMDAGLLQAKDWVKVDGERPERLSDCDFLRIPAMAKVQALSRWFCLGSAEVQSGTPTPRP